MMSTASFKDPNEVTILMKEQHLEMLKGTKHEVGLGVALELIERGVAEIDPLFSARFNKFRSEVKSGVPQSVINEREKRRTDYLKRCEQGIDGKSIVPNPLIQLGV